MTSPHPDNARELLVAEFRRVSARLSHYAGERATRPIEPRSAAATDPVTPLGWLIRCFDLSPFEADIVLLCAAMDLDAECASLVSRLQNAGGPSFSLALAVFEDAHWSALLPDSPLRRWRLVTQTPGQALVSGSLQLDERILHFLLGLSTQDQRLARHATLVDDETDLAPAHAALASRMTAVWDGARRAGNRPPSVMLSGAEVGIRRAIAKRGAQGAALRLLAVDAALLPTHPDELDELARLIEREALLCSAWIVFEAGSDEESQRHALRHVVRRVAMPTVVSADQPVGELTAMLPVTIGPVSPDERATIWGSLAPAASADTLATLAYQFDLPVTAMRLATIEAAATGEAAEAGALPALWEACRRQARAMMPASVERIVPAAAWNRLILPPHEAGLLQSLAAQVKARPQVHGTWGMTPPGAAGIGIAALFSGPSGTGKTLAAEVLANALQLDLYRIDLSLVVSKYIGETEKNLRRLFDAAEAGGAILLFDEADALFGKRSEVKDSHDRHANVEVSYLLQRIEAYSGIAILTTNLRDSLDTAFLRRFRFLIDFPFPGPAQREAIWRASLPETLPRTGIDFARLAQLNLSGGNIRNIALNAAFGAAAQRAVLGMDHLREAARIEYAKLQRSLPEAELKGWQ